MVIKRCATHNIRGWGSMGRILEFNHELFYTILFTSRTFFDKTLRENIARTLF